MGSYLCHQSTLKNHPFKNLILSIFPIFENIKVLVTLLTLRGNHSLAAEYVGQLKLEPIMLFHAINGFELFLALTFIVQSFSNKLTLYGMSKNLTKCLNGNKGECGESNVGHSWIQIGH